MRADRPSLTASLVAAMRALYTALPEPYRLASDPFAAELIPGVLALPARAAALVPDAAPLVHRLAGAVSFGLSYHVALRTRAIDDALREAVALGTTQVVVLGAGLDSRAERLEALAGVRVFEVDHPISQRYKAERLERAGARTRALSLVQVPVDFERDRLEHALLASGLDPAARSFWIWEGVTVYLSPAAFVATLAAVSALSPAGSRLAVTYTRPHRRRAPAGLEPLAHLLVGAAGEPVLGMMETEAMFGALDRAGFHRVSDEGPLEWTARFWPVEAPGAWGTARLRRAEPHCRVSEWERLALAERTESATLLG